MDDMFLVRSSCLFFVPVQPEKVNEAREHLNEIEDVQNYPFTIKSEY